LSGFLHPLFLRSKIIMGLVSMSEETEDWIYVYIQNCLNDSELLKLVLAIFLSFLILLVSKVSISCVLMGHPFLPFFLIRDKFLISFSYLF